MNNNIFDKFINKLMYSVREVEKIHIYYPYFRRLWLLVYGKRIAKEDMNNGLSTMLDTAKIVRSSKVLLYYFRLSSYTGNVFRFRRGYKLMTNNLAYFEDRMEDIIDLLKTNGIDSERIALWDRITENETSEEI